jgi:NAD(P)H-dependent FMN reductase
LRLVTIGMGAFPIPENFSVSHVHKTFNDDGTTNDPSYEEQAKAFLDDVLWFTEAIADRKAKEKKAK